MCGTITQQGRFISTGESVNIPLRAGVDWMRVINYTKSINTTINTGCKYTWQLGMGSGLGLVEFHPAADTTLGIREIAANAGFTYYNTTLQTPGAPVAITQNSGAAAQVISTGNTAGLIANQSVVRLAAINNATGAITAFPPTLSGIDFLVTAVVNNVSFTLPQLATAVPGVVAAGQYRVIPYRPIFSPRRCVVCSITAAAAPTVRTNIPHGYSVGELIRFYVPANCGTVQLNQVEATVLTVPSQNTFTISVDTSAMTAFKWPLLADSPAQYAQVVPIGSAAVDTYGQLDFASENSAEIGMTLAAGALSPAGSNNDIIYWQAGTTFSNV
jgi:hypothetical protein